MPLTAAQQAKVKKILASYRHEVQALVKKHKEAVVTTIETIDKKKTDKIKKLIASA